MRTDSLRTASKRHSLGSYLGAQPDLEPSSLESTLHSFLSTVPEALGRCRKTRLAPVDGSPSQRTKPAEGAEAPPCSRERAGKKEQRRQKQPENERKAEKLQTEEPEGSPQRSGGAHGSPATPRTPRPTTRDYYFGHGGKLGSPWTILSPVTSVHTEARTGTGSQCRLASTSRGDDLDDGVWDSDEAIHVASCSAQKAASPAGEDPLLGHRSGSKPPVRSASVDETSQSLTSRFSLGDLFQRSMCQRSYSHGSRTETPSARGVRSAFSARSELEVGKTSSSGFRSFFRRIGGKARPVGAEEAHLKRPNI